MLEKIYLSSMGMVCALGNRPEQILEKLLAGDRCGVVADDSYFPDKSVHLGKVVLTDVSEGSPLSRNNQLLLEALAQIQPEAERLKAAYGSDRIGVVLGTSTSGTSNAEAAMIQWQQQGQFPEGYQYRTQEMGDTSRFLADHLGLHGPAYTVSTACSSSGKVFLTARNLIQSGFCDAVIAGGCDSLCQLTVQGFSALESVAAERCQPFSEGRDGINLGEGAALFTVTREVSDIVLMGVGESSDAHHISAPHPEGRGARQAMAAALKDAQLPAEAISYLNLHGTATPLNDAMESQAVSELFADNQNERFCCSSTKPVTGHTLGAAGAVEAGLLWLLLSSHNKHRKLPPHVADNPRDPAMADLKLASAGDQLPDKNICIMSNSFAFGGSNVSVILGQSSGI